MDLIRVDSIDDQRVAVYRELHRRDLIRRSGLFIVEGQLLVERLLASSFEAHSILVDERRLSTLPESAAGKSVFVAEAGLLEEIVGFNFHRGVLACGYRRTPLAIASLTDVFGETALVVLCVDVQDPTNLGTILRNSAAFGVDAVIVTRQCADPFSRRVVRVSMGAALKLPIVESDNIQQCFLELREQHRFELIATVVEGGMPLETAKRTKRTALMIGNEAHGLPDDIVSLADRGVTIPMQLQTDSLNVSVATGVMLYHFTRVAVTE
ncbi:MAG: RNA methyltransferase [Planctomycetaceae bacterium]